jgi:Fe-S cluster assembly scaffold protein SufB
MKITEITEGFVNTDEAFADSWSTVKKGGRDLGRLATGAAWRQTKDMARGVAGKMGFAGPAEKQKMQRIAGGVAKNFKAWTTQRGLAQEVDALQQYLTAVGFDAADIKISASNTAMWEGEVSEAVPSNAQIASAKAKGQAQQQAQDTGPSRGAQPLNRTELIKTIADTIQSALKNNRVPKTIEKFTKV